MPSDINTVTPRVAYILYLNHFLSTWNGRMYEHAVTVITAVAYPKDLTASSIFGIAMNLSIVLLASSLGTWVDKGQSRLTTLISTISANRISMIAAWICWFFIVGLQDVGSVSTTVDTMGSTHLTMSLKSTLFVVVLILSVVERLSRTANLLSIERDWAPVIAAPESSLKLGELPQRFGLTQINAVMSRIDLVCNLISPIMSVIISVIGVKISIVVMLCLNGFSWIAEIWSARSVWNSCDRLQASKKLYDKENGSIEMHKSSERLVGRFGKFAPNIYGPWWQRGSQRVYAAFQTTRGRIITWFQNYYVNLRIYFDHDVWVPSMALSILHFSVLNYSTTLVTYLNQFAGFSWNTLAIAKWLSALAELGSTFFTPLVVQYTRKILAQREKAMSRNGTTRARDEDNEDLLSDRKSGEEEEGVEEEGYFIPQVDMGLAMLGFYSLIQMLISLIPSYIALWILSITPRSSTSKDSFTSPMLITVVLLTTIPFSRLGHETYHLTTQQLTQTQVPALHRSTFAGTEMGFTSLFGLAHWIITAIWSAHGQFLWLALGSLGAIECGLGIYALWLNWVKKERYRGKRKRGKTRLEL